MAAVKWQAFCCQKESGCPKVGSQIGKYGTEQAAIAALKHHLVHSNYHYMEEPVVIHNMGEFIVRCEDTSGTVDLSPASSSLPPRPPPPPAPVNLLRKVAPTCNTDLASRPVSPNRSKAASRQRSRSRPRTAVHDDTVNMPRAHYWKMHACLERSEHALRAAARVAQAASKSWSQEADAIVAMRKEMFNSDVD